MDGKINRRLARWIVSWVTGALLAIIIFGPAEDFEAFLTYTKHSWIETEARYVSSSERYIHVYGNFAIKVYDGFSGVTYCDWLYRYEIDGREYDINSTMHEESSPDSKHLVKKILVAKDDNELYFFVSRAEMLLNIAARLIGAALVIALFVRINKFIANLDKEDERESSCSVEL